MPGKSKKNYYHSDSDSEDSGRGGGILSNYLLGFGKTTSYSSDESESEDRYFKKTKFGCHEDEHHSSSSSCSSGSDCDTSSGTSEEEMQQGHGHHGHGSHGSHGSHHGHSPFMKQSKKYEKEPEIDLKLKKLVYGFNVLTDTKSKKDLIINSKDLHIQSAPRNNDSNYERASENADIITKCYLTLQTNFDGTLQIEFPTIKCLDGTVCFDQDHITITTNNINTKKKGKTFELINRNLTNKQKEFLKNYPGQTQENFEKLCSKTPGKNKIVQVGLEPESCLTHYLGEFRRPSYFKQTKNYLEMPLDFYNKLVKAANEDFEKNYAFSDVSKESFSFKIKPLKNTTIQNMLDITIDKFKAQKEQLDKKNKINKELNEQLKFLTAPGFSNFYTTNVVNLTQDQMSEKYKTFSKGINYQFKGTLTIEYYQVTQKKIEMKKKFK